MDWKKRRKKKEGNLRYLLAFKFIIKFEEAGVALLKL